MEPRGTPVAWCKGRRLTKHGLGVSGSKPRAKVQRETAACPVKEPGRQGRARSPRRLRLLSGLSVAPTEGLCYVQTRISQRIICGQVIGK